MVLLLPFYNNSSNNINKAQSNTKIYEVQWLKMYVIFIITALEIQLKFLKPHRQNPPTKKKGSEHCDLTENK